VAGKGEDRAGLVRSGPPIPKIVGCAAAPAPAAAHPSVDPAPPGPSATLIVAAAEPTSVVVDGEARGTTPLTVSVPRYAWHRIELAAHDGRTLRKTVYVRHSTTRVRVAHGRLGVSAAR
jgi:hypothetical protein